MRPVERSIHRNVYEDHLPKAVRLHPARSFEKLSIGVSHVDRIVPESWLGYAYRFNMMSSFKGCCYM